MSLRQHYESLTFTNRKGETFHVSVFPPLGARARGEEDGAPPVLFCVHGAGMSGESFFRLAEYLQNEGRSPPSATVTDPVSASRPPPSSATAPASLGRPAVAPTSAAMAGPAGDCAFMPPQLDGQGDEIAVAVVTFDLRCHGQSTFAGGEDQLTLDVMARDFQEVLQFAKTEVYPKSDFYVLGHSLGGPIVALGLSNREHQSRIAGVVLVDVVEGTAKLSLKYMHDFLEKRPESFDTLEEAKAWFLKHGGMRSPEGAAVSVPPLLQKDAATGKYRWKTDLAKMEGVWDGWFEKLNSMFISLPFPKMLCLANAERLDTELTVAQMQGKFQFEIIGGNCGHYVMDDATAVLGSKMMRLIKRIETLTRKLKAGIVPGATIPPSRQGA